MLAKVGSSSGNEKADVAAKKPQDGMSNSTLRFINSLMNNMWQMEWDECHGSKLHEINPSTRKTFFINFKSRYDQVVFTRCCLGHIRLTQLFIKR